MNLQQKLSKELYQIVFRPTIASEEGFLSVAKNYEPKFGEWTRQDNTYSLYSIEPPKAMLFHSSSIAYNAEVHTGATVVDNDYLADMLEAFTKYQTLFSIREIRRVSCSTTKVFTTNLNISDVCKALHGKFYSSDFDSGAISSKSSLSNVRFELGGEKSEFKNNVVLGSADAVQGLQQFNSAFQGFEDKLNLGNGNIYLSLEIFRDNNVKEILAADLQGALKGLKRESLRLTEEITNYINV